MLHTQPPPFQERIKSLSQPDNDHREGSKVYDGVGGGNRRDVSHVDITQEIRFLGFYCGQLPSNPVLF
jgi:hypothetical protein